MTFNVLYINLLQQKFILQSYVKIVPAFAELFNVCSSDDRKVR